MANEISAAVSLGVSKNGATISNSYNGNGDLSGTEMLSSVQQFSTANSQAVSIGGCDQVNALMIKNLDSSIAITVSLDTTHTQVISVIPAGRAVLLWGIATTFYCKSASGTVDVMVTVCET